MEQKIGFIGAGNMGGALITALAKSGYSNIIVCDINEGTLTALEDEYDITTTTDNTKVAEEAGIIVVSVKPQHMEKALEGTGNYLKNKLIISIAAGKTLDYLKEKVGHDRIIRTMPFMGNLYGHGATAYTFGKGCYKDDKKAVEQLFGSEGIIFEVKEEQMEAVTYLASSPGLIAMYLQEMIDELKDHGLHEQVCRDYLANVMYTLGDMIKQGKDLKEVYKMVASRGGTTEAAHNYAMKHDFYVVLKGMINAAVERCRELR